MRILTTLAITATLGACAPNAVNNSAPGTAPANTTPANEPAPAPAERQPGAVIPPDELDRGPQPQCRTLGEQKLAGMTISAELELPWKEGDAPAFRIKTSDKAALTGWLENKDGKRVTQPARLLPVEGSYRLFPVVNDLRAGNYMLVIEIANATAAEPARFLVKLP